MSRRSTAPVVWVIAITVVAVEWLFGMRYPLFRDELYYLACADHLDFGYVDQPPLSIAVLAGVRAVLGDSLPAVRVVPSLLAGLLVVLVARIARVLGGGRAAQGIAALAAAAAPMLLGGNGLYSMNAFDLAFWALAALLVARIVAEDNHRLYLPLGVVLGLGLENKLSVLFLLAGLGVAMLATPLRRHLARREPWIALGITAILAAPYVAWEVGHGWPTLEFMANATRYKNVAMSPWQFIASQLLEMNPLAAPVWLSGLAWLLFGRDGARFRALGIVYLVAFAILTLQHGKPYYLGAAYAPLFAAGGVCVERLRARALRVAAPVAIAAGGALAAPLAIPVLPVETLIAYQGALGLAPAPAEHQALGPLAQHFADRFGWPELTQSVVAIYRSLPPDEQARVVIVGDNYGEAAAIDYYGRRYGLPRAISQHNSYYLWGPGRDKLDVAIIIGMDADDLRSAWRHIDVRVTVTSPYAMPYERRPILVCHDLLLPLDQAWREGRHFI